MNGEMKKQENSGEIQKLIKDLGHRLIKRRETAAELLGKLNAKQALPHLESRLDDKNVNVRLEVLRSIHSIAPIKSESYLIRGLSDKNFEIKHSCISWLGKIGSRKYEPHLIGSLNKEKGFLKGLAARYLGEIGTIRSIPHLLKSATSQNSYVSTFSK